MMHAGDLDSEGRSSLKRPPLKRHRRGLKHPVGLQPVDHVIVARRSDELTARPSSNVFLHRMTADLRDLSIDHGAEFVDCNQIAALEKLSRKLDAKALAGREHAIRLHP